MLVNSSGRADQLQNRTLIRMHERCLSQCADCNCQGRCAGFVCRRLVHMSWNAQGQSARSSLGETLAWLRGKTHYFYWFSNPNPNAQDAVCNVTQDPIEFTGCAIRWKQESNCGGLFERRQDLSHIDISQISAARTSDDRWRVVGVPEWSQSEDIVKRAVVAIRHAAMLCGAKPEPF